MSFATLLTNTMTIYSKTFAKNQIGEDIETDVELATAVPCRLDTINGADTIYMDNIAVKIDVRVFCQYRSDISEWDHVVIDSINYKIASINNVSGYGKNSHAELDCYVIKRI